VDALWLGWWWIVWLALALLYQPLAARLLGGLCDGGWAFARVLGLGVSSYLCWLAASQGLASFSRPSALVATLLPALALHLRAGGVVALLRFLRRRRRAVLAVEALFAATLLLFALLRALRPDVAGLEKFMDYGFAAAAARSPFMPPPDMWFAGETINYYYYGHFLLAFLSKASGVPLPVAYNLMVASLPALCASLAFTLGAQLAGAFAGGGRRLRAGTGLLAAALLVLGANLHGFVYGVALPAAEALGLTDGAFRSPMQLAAGHYWYADATRFVGHHPPTQDRLIHEFPFYSFLVADLHAHVSGLPWALALLALLAARPLARGSHRSPLFEALVLGASLGFVLGLIRMTNTWDLPVHAGVSAAVLGLQAVSGPPPRGRALGAAALALTAAAAVAGLVSLPFALHFEQHYGGLERARHHTPLRQLAVLWGVPACAVALTALHRIGGALRARALGRGEALWLALAVCAFGLLLVPELVFVRDIYPAPYERGNTYFKLSYQAFVLLCLLLPGAVASFAAVPGRFGWRRVLAAAALAPLFCYAPLAIRGHFGPVGGWRLHGLDGLAFLARRGTGEDRALAWLVANAVTGDALLEADGASYSDAGRFSMASGIPTVLGWHVHEWLWRGGKRSVNARSAEVRLVYEFPRLRAVPGLLERYRVRFMVVGPLERQRFPGLDEADLERLGRVAFSSGEVKIIEVPRPAATASPTALPRPPGAAAGRAPARW